MRGWMLIGLIVTAAGCVQPAFVWPEQQASDCETEEIGCSRLFAVDGSVSQVLHHDDALYVAEQTGLLWRVVDEEAEVALDVRERIATCHYEQGLLGVAFHAGALYVTYTEDAPCDRKERWQKGDLVLARYTTDGDPLRDGEVLLRVPQPFRNHNGGHIVSGPDGMLYVGVGDGGDHGDPLKTGGDPTDLLGSILRLDVSGPTAAPAPGNPFSMPQGDPRVLHYGLRNPWRFTFDGQGGLWIADVGQDCFEELSYLPPYAAGVDLGWSRTEGHALYPSKECKAEDKLPAGVHAPVWTYGRDDGCSITGGPVLPDAAPWSTLGVAGHIVVSDFCSGKVWTVDHSGSARLLLKSGLQITSMGLAPEGLLVGGWHGEVRLLHVPGLDVGAQATGA